MRVKANLDIRIAANQAKVRLWEIAERLEMQDSAFSRKLRKELSSEEKNVIIEVIRQLSEEREGR